jgi:hypothetical protein
MKKLEMLETGKQLAQEFCEANQLEMPTVNVVPNQAWRFNSTCAYYRQQVIHIAPARCAPEGRGGPAWSYPGYVVDRTPHGVIQHELGHHVDHVRSKIKGAYGGDFSVNLRQWTGEDKITNYCPNDWEWFAEIFRLFVTNSDLLRELRPRTYQQLRELFKPVVDEPWRQVLKDAPPRNILAAERKIAA